MVVWNFDLLWKNYSTMKKKTMELYRKLLNFDLLWENYDTMERLWYNEKKLWYYSYIICYYSKL